MTFLPDPKFSNVVRAMLCLLCSFLSQGSGLLCCQNIMRSGILCHSRTRTAVDFALFAEFNTQAASPTIKQEGSRILEIVKGKAQANGHTDRMQEPPQLEHKSWWLDRRAV